MKTDMKYFRILIVILISSSIFACSNNKKQTEFSENEKKSSFDEEEDFDQFYQEYCKDSVFQKSRTQFPLPTYDTSQDFGIDSDQNISGDTVYITEHQWKMRHFISENDSLYKKDIIKTDSIVYEKVYIPMSDYQVLSFFKLNNHKWFLVFISL
jgi:hypothetical protein